MLPCASQRQPRDGPEADALFLNPEIIRFSQDSIEPYFKTGAAGTAGVAEATSYSNALARADALSLDTVVQSLISGACKPEDFPCIRVVQHTD